MAFMYYVFKYMYLATMLKAIVHACTPTVCKRCIKNLEQNEDIINIPRLNFVCTRINKYVDLHVFEALIVGDITRECTHHVHMTSTTQ